MSRSATKLLSDQVSRDELAVILRELSAVLARRTTGDVVELGCYIGTTSVWLARELAGTGKSLYLYDSFQGLPRKSVADASPLGEQFVAGELLASEKVLQRNLRTYAPDDVSIMIKKAWFSELSAADLPAEIAFAFLDGDFYQSISDSLRLVWPKLTATSTVVVDDYTNQALPGVERALTDWQRGHSFSIRHEKSLAILTNCR